MNFAMSYHQFTAKLRAAGWVSAGQGQYKHECGGAVNLFDAPGGVELWRQFVHNDRMPDPALGQVAQTIRAASDRGVVQARPALRFVRIRCPECGLVQGAAEQFVDTPNGMLWCVHLCIGCWYTITEDDWHVIDD